MYSLLLRVDKVMAKYSPVTLIQRWTRGWLVRKALLKSKDPSIKSVHYMRRIQHSARLLVSSLGSLMYGLRVGLVTRLNSSDKEKKLPV